MYDTFESIDFWNEVGEVYVLLNYKNFYSFLKRLTCSNIVNKNLETIVIFQKYFFIGLGALFITVYFFLTFDSSFTNHFSDR